MPGKLMRTRGSGRAKERCLSSSSMLWRRSFRPRMSSASSATIAAATTCAGRVTFWDLAAPSALCATLLDHLRPRFL
jgi:hypothetical protein